MVAILLFANLLTWYVIFRENRVGVLTVSFFDIGQGDSIFIESPTGNQVLVDGGSSGSPVLSRLGETMPFYDHTLDVVIGTHADSDHIGGLSSVLSRYKVELVLFPDLLGKDTQAYRSFTDSADANVSNVVRARRGQRLDLGGGAMLTLLWPDPKASLSESNDESVVALLSLGKTNYLLTGDAPQWVERQLIVLDDATYLLAQVLKAGHHGSKTSNAQEFLDMVKPGYAIISAGKDNRYGHPHQEVLSRLSGVGAKILRTDEEGSIVLKSDGNKVIVVDQ